MLFNCCDDAVEMCIGTEFFIDFHDKIYIISIIFNVLYAVVSSGRFSCKFALPVLAEVQIILFCRKLFLWNYCYTCMQKNCQILQWQKTLEPIWRHGIKIFYILSMKNLSPSWEKDQTSELRFRLVLPKSGFSLLQLTRKSETWIATPGHRCMFARARSPTSTARDNHIRKVYNCPWILRYILLYWLPWCSGCRNYTLLTNLFLETWLYVFYVSRWLGGGGTTLLG